LAKTWNREHRVKPPTDETPEQKKERQAKTRKENRARPFVEKESYRWVEAMTTVARPSPSGIVVIVFSDTNKLNAKLINHNIFRTTTFIDFFFFSDILFPFFSTCTPCLSRFVRLCSSFHIRCVGNIIWAIITSINSLFCVITMS
jgi:hypothetical protein